MNNSDRADFNLTKMAEKVTIICIDISMEIVLNIIELLQIPNILEISNLYNLQ
jgi:hypothetical protein